MRDGSCSQQSCEIPPKQDTSGVVARVVLAPCLAGRGCLTLYNESRSR